MAEKRTMFSLLIVALLSMQVAAVNNYLKCFNCFYENREGYSFCGGTGECLSNLAISCSDEWIETYFDCPEQYVTTGCGNYTFTKDSFGQSGDNAIVESMRLMQGEACIMTIDRTIDGSYGTVTIQFDNPYLMVFDDINQDFVSNDKLGLIEVPTQDGWNPRTFLVANAAVTPVQFNAIYDSAAQTMISILSMSIASYLIIS